MKIAVLMSTYNGEKYIRQQLDSIINQKGIEPFLFIRDDGSKDATAAILAEYEESYPEIVHFLNKNKIENYGVKKSYLSLMKEVYTAYPDMQYFAFADQDDFWKEQKLEAAVKKLEECGANPKGRLYYSNKTFVDQNLNLIKEEKIKYYGDFNEAMWASSLCYGCTMVFDRTLVGFALRTYPQTKCIHDSWVYRLAKAIDSAIVFDTNSYILYRQHGNNAIGMEGAKLHHNNIGFMIKRALPVLFMKRTHHMQRFMNDIYCHYKDELGAHQKKMIESMLKYRFSLKHKWILIRNKDLKKRSLKTRMIWAYTVLFNRL